MHLAKGQTEIESPNWAGKRLFETSDIILGEWVDAKNEYFGWGDAQVIDKQANKVKVRYFGWGSTYDEWINLPSDRLALFRSKTVQSCFNKYYSPHPNNNDTSSLAFFGKFDDEKHVKNLICVLKDLTKQLEKLTFTEYYTYVTA